MAKLKSTGGPAVRNTAAAAAAADYAKGATEDADVAVFAQHTSINDNINTKDNIHADISGTVEEQPASFDDYHFSDGHDSDADSRYRLYLSGDEDGGTQANQASSQYTGKAFADYAPQSNAEAGVGAVAGVSTDSHHPAELDSQRHPQQHMEQLLPPLSMLEDPSDSRQQWQQQPRQNPLLDIQELPPTHRHHTANRTTPLHLPHPFFKTYDPSTLHWNELKTFNEESQYCYCGQDRALDVFMVQCSKCKNWFHEACVNTNLSPNGFTPVPLFTCYVFCCAACAPQHRETYKQVTPVWKEIAATGLAYLMMSEIRRRYTDMSGKNYMRLLTSGEATFYFSRDQVADFVAKFWPVLWGSHKDKNTIAWKSTLSTTLFQYRELFVNTSDARVTTSPLTLFDQNLLNVRPGHVELFSKTGVNGQLPRGIVPPRQAENMVRRTGRLTLQRGGVIGIARPPTRAPRAVVKTVGGTAASSASVKKSSVIAVAVPPSIHASTIIFPTAKAEFVGCASGVSVRRREAAIQRQSAGEEGAALLPFPAVNATSDEETIFCNRDGYKYELAELNHTSLRYALYRSALCTLEGLPGVCLSREDSSPSIFLNSNSNSCWSNGGFRLARASIGARSGYWYFEVLVLPRRNQQQQQQHTGSNSNHGNPDEAMVASRVSSFKMASVAPTPAAIERALSRKRKTIEEYPAYAKSNGFARQISIEEMQAYNTRPTPMALDLPAHVRIGVSRRDATLFGPVGCDGAGFAYRDKTGELVNDGRRRVYGEPYSAGDIIGVLLVLPPWHEVVDGAGGGARKNSSSNGKGPRDERERHIKFLPRDAPSFACHRKKFAVQHNSRVFLESRDYVAKSFAGSISGCEVPGSRLEFFKNGVAQGIAANQLLAPLARMYTQPAGNELAIAPSAATTRQTICTPAQGGVVAHAMVATAPAQSSVLAENFGAASSTDANVSAGISVVDDGSLGYYPAVSCYNGGACAVNFGPHFVFRPPDDYDPASKAAGASGVKLVRAAGVPPATAKWRPYSERYLDKAAEECVWDLVDEVEYWWALDYVKNASLLAHPRARFDRGEFVAAQRLVYPARDETYAQHAAAVEAAASASARRETDGSGFLAPVRRARVKWAAVNGVGDNCSGAALSALPHTSSFSTTATTATATTTATT